MVFCLACAACPDFSLLFVDIANLAVAGVLSYAVYLLADFVPRTYGSCNRVGAWASTNDGRNFYVEAYTQETVG
jgi:hypothetical protein